MAKTRTEKDTFGPLEVPGEHYWGAQTERSRGNFKIGKSSHGRDWTIRPVDWLRLDIIQSSYSSVLRRHERVTPRLRT